ncbi:hypothetical protein ACCC88_11030 [Sphingomonas sp. Sphisp140]|uniref:hypothetical protein n=1 Tax=unclassified Sphingomonas TaxID=196159 RepID=UPI0039AED972
MNKHMIFRAALTASLVTCAPAIAQTTGTTSTGTVTVTGTVPSLCFGGTLTGGSNIDLGVLIDTTTGLLRTDLPAPTRTLTGAFCSSRSVISVDATPLLTQNATGTPPAGFSRTVNYRATASGWSPTSAVFTTGAATNPAASQNRDTAFQSDITITLDNFLTGGGTGLRLVSDPLYRGAVTVTLSVAD